MRIESFRLKIPAPETTPSIPAATQYHNKATTVFLGSVVEQEMHCQRAYAENAEKIVMIIKVLPKDVIAFGLWLWLSDAKPRPCSGLCDWRLLIRIDVPTAQ